MSEEKWVKELKKHKRSILVTLINSSDRTLNRRGKQLKHGRFRPGHEPPNVLAPGQTFSFGAEGVTPFSGTEGVVQYEASGLTGFLLCYWDNPKLGKPTVGAIAPPPLAVNTHHDLDKYSEVVFQIYESDEVLPKEKQDSLVVSETADEGQVPISETSIDSPGDIESHYEITDHVLGTGGFSEVRLCINLKTGERCAVKIMPSASGKLMKNEVKIMKQLKHNNIIMLRDVFETSEKLYIVMELVTGGELLDRILNRKNFYYTERHCSIVMKQVFSAIKYLHDNNIAHRDLKPENLLLDEAGNVKLADFGLSKVYAQQSIMYTACGTSSYMAPEVIMCKRGATLGYDKECDLWSLGVIMWCLICGYNPFRKTEQDNLLENILTGNYHFDEYWENMSESSKDLMRNLLVVDPKKRFTAAQALNHPWVQGETATDAPLHNRFINFVYENFRLNRT